MKTHLPLYALVSKPYYGYDYNLQLVKIVDLGILILRIGSNPNENTIYLIGVKEDFVLAKYTI